MMNYAAAYGALRGLLFGVQMECKYGTQPIDGQELAAKIETAIKESETYGYKYEEVETCQFGQNDEGHHHDPESNHR